MVHFCVTQWHNSQCQVLVHLQVYVKTFFHLRYFSVVMDKWNKKIMPGELIVIFLFDTKYFRQQWKVKECLLLVWLHYTFFFIWSELLSWWLVNSNLLAQHKVWVCYPYISFLNHCVLYPLQNIQLWHKRIDAVDGWHLRTFMLTVSYV